MNKGKVDKVVEQLLRSGFSMTSREFYKTTLERILKRYGVEESLSADEYFELLKQLADACMENDLRDMGIFYASLDDMKDK